MPPVRPDLQSVRRQLGAEFPDILELGERAGTAAFLGRRPEGGVALLLLKPAAGGHAYELEVSDALADDFPLGRTACPACGRPHTGWPRFCRECGTDMAGAVAAGPPPTPPGGYELLGALPRAGGGGPLYFAREAATGRVVGLAGRRGLAGGLELSPAWSPGAGPRGRAPKAVAAGVFLLSVLGAAVAGARGPARPDAPGGPSPRPVAGASTDPAPSTVPAAPFPVDTGRAVAPPAGEAAQGPPGGAATPGRPVAAAAATESPSSPPGAGGRERPDAPGPQASAPGPSTAPPAAAGGPQGVEDAIRRYAAAVGSGQTSRIAQAYPGVTPAELERWSRFYAPLGRDARLRAWHEVVSGPTLQGDRAEVLFTLTVAYENGRGEPVERPLPLRARLRWTGSAWALQEVLLLQ